MTRSEALRFYRLARQRVEQRWGKRLHETLSAEIREALVYKEAALLVLGQAGEKYEPAQDLLRAAIAGVS